MEDFKYIGEMFNSVKEVFQKPVLLMPFLYVFILGVIFSLFTPNMPMPGPGQLPDMKILWSIVFLTLLQTLIALVFYAMGLVGMRMHANGENVTCRDQSSKGVKIYWKMLLQKIYIFMIFALPAIALLLIFGLMKSSKLDPSVVGMVGVVLALIYTVFAIAMALFYLFSNAIIAYDGKSAVASLKESHSYFKRDVAHVVLTFFSLLLFVILTLVVVLLVSVPLVLATQSQAVMFWQNLLVSLIMLPASAAITLYLFKAYLNGGEEGQKAEIAEKKENKTTPAAVAVAEKKTAAEVKQETAKSAEKPAAKPAAKTPAKPAVKSKPATKPSAKPVAKPGKK